MVFQCNKQISLFCSVWLQVILIVDMILFAGPPSLWCEEIQSADRACQTTVAGTTRPARPAASPRSWAWNCVRRWRTRAPVCPPAPQGSHWLGPWQLECTWTRRTPTPHTSSLQSPSTYVGLHSTSRLSGIMYILFCFFKYFKLFL